MECPDGYITRLGTCFHDRVAELGVLERIFRGEYDPSLLIVYGPMRVGKSELLRYTLSRRVRGLGDIYPVLVDARAEAGRRLFENVNVSIEPVFQTTSRALSETFLRNYSLFLITFNPFNAIK
jgi:AAA+ ATPase superfamily predicted ATPase